MKRVHFSLLCLVALVPFAAQAAVIDFDNLPGGGALPNNSVLTNQYASVGVIFEGFEGSAVAQPIATTVFSGQVGGAPVSGQYLMNLNAADNRADVIRMRFSGPASGIAFDFIPFGSGGANTSLQAFDTGGTLIFNDVIGGTTVINSNIHYTGLSGLTGVARLDILQPGDIEPWGMDNLQYRNAVSAPVPEPGSLGLLCVGVLGLAHLRRKRKTAG
jgi:hypothetical protein